MLTRADSLTLGCHLYTKSPFPHLENENDGACCIGLLGNQVK